MSCKGECLCYTEQRVVMLFHSCLRIKPKTITKHMASPLVLRIKSINIYLSLSGEKDNLNYPSFIFDQECICKIQELPLLHSKNIHKRTCAFFSFGTLSQFILGQETCMHLFGCACMHGCAFKHLF